MCNIFSFCKLFIFLVFFVSIFISIEVEAGKNGLDSNDNLQVDLLNNSSTKIEDLSYLTSKEFQELANRANMNYLAAQREILFRIYWGKRPEDYKKYIKIDRWRNLEKITKSNLGFYLILQTCTA